MRPLLIVALARASYACVTIDSTSSQIYFGNIDGATGSIHAPEGTYATLELLAAAVSAEALVDSGGTSRALSATWNSADNTMTFALADVAAWYITDYFTAGFWSAIGYAGSQITVNNPTTSALSTTCVLT